MPKIIGFTGLAGAGKDTCAHIVSTHCKGKVYSYAFADPIKGAVKALFDMSDAQMHHPGMKEMPDARWGGKTPRQLMQWLGTDIMRAQFDKDFFTRHMHMRLDSHAESDSVVLVTDVRFDNEAELIHKMGGVVVLIEREGHERTHSHSSENGVSSHLVTTTIFNDGKSIENLTDTVLKKLFFM